MELQNAKDGAAQIWITCAPEQQLETAKIRQPICGDYVLDVGIGQFLVPCITNGTTQAKYQGQTNKHKANISLKGQTGKMGYETRS